MNVTRRLFNKVCIGGAFAPLSLLGSGDKKPTHYNNSYGKLQSIDISLNLTLTAPDYKVDELFTITLFYEKQTLKFIINIITFKAINTQKEYDKLINKLKTLDSTQRHTYNNGNFEVPSNGKTYYVEYQNQTILTLYTVDENTKPVIIEVYGIQKRQILHSGV